MINKKEKILAEALRLFNENGLSEVSLRKISDTMNISVGNLQYHFRKREHIVEQLYFQLVERIDVSVNDNINDAVSLDNLFSLNQTIATAFFEYRFFFLEFVVIIRNHDKIKTHYKQLSAQREAEFLNVMSHLASDGVVHEESFEGEYRQLYQQVEVVSNFWLSSASLKTDILTEKVIEEYAKMMWQCLYPYLINRL